MKKALILFVFLLPNLLFAQTTYIGQVIKVTPNSVTVTVIAPKLSLIKDRSFCSVKLIDNKILVYDIGSHYWTLLPSEFQDGSGVPYGSTVLTAFQNYKLADELAQSGGGGGSSLPAGASTAVRQDTSNYYLKSINSNLSTTTKVGTVKAKLVKDTTEVVNGSTVLYWCACNTGYIDAEIQFSGDVAVALYPGMCYWEYQTYDQATKTIHEPASATIFALNNAQVNFIKKLK
jgi:hypothetical protein